MQQTHTTTGIFRMFYLPLNNRPNASKDPAVAAVQDAGEHRVNAGLPNQPFDLRDGQ